MTTAQEKQLLLKVRLANFASNIAYILPPGEYRYSRIVLDNVKETWSQSFADADIFLFGHNGTNWLFEQLINEVAGYSENYSIRINIIDGVASLTYSAFGFNNEVISGFKFKTKLDIWI